VTPAHNAKLVAPELLEHRGQAVRHLSGELSDEPIFAAGDVVDLAPEETAQIKKAGARHCGEKRLYGGRSVRHEAGADTTSGRCAPAALDSTFS
jgi:hypothetical protein